MPSDPQRSSDDDAALSAEGVRQGQPSAGHELPEAEALLDLERQARRQGTHLTPSDLDGLWWLERVWPRGQRRASALSGVLLRGLGASLRIEAVAGGDPDSAAGLHLTNAVRLGPLQLRFQGPGRLEGTRPLLLFQFDRLEILAADRVLLMRSLPEPIPRRQPFFALIASGERGCWLAARGRSGGLAVWRRDVGSVLANPESP